jgi:hypothetical protein
MRLNLNELLSEQVIQAGLALNLLVTLFAVGAILFIERCPGTIQKPSL